MGLNVYKLVSIWVDTNSAPTYTKITKTNIFPDLDATDGKRK